VDEVPCVSFGEARVRGGRPGVRQRV
jgi:hypothetical protein